MCAQPLLACSGSSGLSARLARPRDDHGPWRSVPSSGTPASATAPLSALPGVPGWNREPGTAMATAAGSTEQQRPVKAPPPRLPDTRFAPPPRQGGDTTPAQVDQAHPPGAGLPSDASQGGPPSRAKAPPPPLPCSEAQGWQAHAIQMVIQEARRAGTYNQMVDLLVAARRQTEALGRPPTPQDRLPDTLLGPRGVAPLRVPGWNREPGRHCHGDGGGIH